ncbi:MAG: DUF4349 domain-containing protein [Patescibacteria group bacterium]|jgi:hypothetical protein
MATKNTSSVGFWVAVGGGTLAIVLLLSFSWYTNRSMMFGPITSSNGIVRNMMGFGTISTGSSTITSTGAIGAPMMDQFSKESGFADTTRTVPSPIPPMMYGGDTAATATPRIIKTGSLTLEVKSSREGAQKVSEIAGTQGGFVESSNVVENNDGTVSAYATIRVPEAKFEATLGALRALALRVSSESINGQDVTEQYTDLQARLTNAQAQEQQYLEILKKATTITDILAVQQNLSQIRYQIESYQGQIKSLGNQTTYSTISVTLIEQANLNIPAGKFDLMRDIKQAGQSVILLAQALMTFAVWFIIIGGAFLIPIAVIVYVIYRLVRRVTK